MWEGKTLSVVLMNMPRVGASSVTGNPLNALLVGLLMILLVRNGMTARRDSPSGIPME